LQGLQEWLALLAGCLQGCHQLQHTLSIQVPHGLLRSGFQGLDQVTHASIVLGCALQLRQEALDRCNGCWLLQRHQELLLEAAAQLLQARGAV
jgi:hypothetical protein